MKKKIIAVLLSACMLVSACPTGAFAMSDEETNTYTATGDVMQGGAPVVDETPAPEETATPEETAAPEETPTPAPEETPTSAPVETPAPVEVEDPRRRCRGNCTGETERGNGHCNDYAASGRREAQGRYLPFL